MTNVVMSAVTNTGTSNNAIGFDDSVSRSVWSEEDVLQYEPVKRILGMFRSVDGVLSLTSGHLVFESLGAGAIVVPLTDVAWVEVARRSKSLVIEVTTRSALVTRFSVTTPEWATRIRKSRDSLMGAALENADHSASSVAS
jgi:hypothetical protein